MQISEREVPQESLAFGGKERKFMCLEQNDEAEE